MVDNIRTVINVVLDEPKINLCDKWRFLLLVVVNGSGFIIGDVFES
jgi:hypothetical protein